jgi:hypothetical protein
MKPLIRQSLFLAIFISAIFRLADVLLDKSSKLNLEFIVKSIIFIGILWVIFIYLIKRGIVKELKKDMEKLIAIVGIGIFVFLIIGGIVV